MPLEALDDQARGLLALGSEAPVREPMKGRERLGREWNIELLHPAIVGGRRLLA